MVEKLYHIGGGNYVTRANYPKGTPQQIAANRAAAATRTASASHMSGINSIGKPTPTPTKGHNSRGKTLVADTSDSVCFSDLRFKGGTVYATFAKDNSQYTYDMTRGEAKEWFDDDLGRYFNAVVR